jgi:protoporphyrinogen oxidase
MEVAIIGAGFGGLSVGYRLSKNGVGVTIFETGEKPGGLAIGFRQPQWDWTVEKHYHHWFTNDNAVLNLAKEINHPVIVKRPVTSTYINGKSRQLDSPLSLLQFGDLPIADRMRMGAVLAYLKATNNWRKLEKITANDFIVKYMGQKSWNVLWKPLFEGKFADYADSISASWFWARIKKRTPFLAYPKRGFLAFSEKLAEEIKKMGGEVHYNTHVAAIAQNNGKLLLNTRNDAFMFDKVICTLPSSVFIKITNLLPNSYVDNLLKTDTIGAVELILSLKKQFLQDDTYWLNMDKSRFPFLAVVEHTNFMNKKYYNNEHLLYIGNYLSHSHEYFDMNKKQLFYEYLPYLTKINPEFRASWVNDKFKFEDFFAQPIYEVNYSANIPDFETPIEGLYLLNMEQVYPWDRGTNYAVENGEKVARMVLESS